MRRTSGTHAIAAAMGAGFWVDDLDAWMDRHDIINPRVLTMDHPDGRVLTFTVKPGDGRQEGDLVKVQASGGWAPAVVDRVARTLPELRAMLAEHEPDRELTYEGHAPIPQVRDLDGRERDILYRVVKDVLRCLFDPRRRSRFLDLIEVDQVEWPRLVEISAVLDTRED